MELKGRRGSSILEFAIAVSVMVLFFTGVFQFGYTFYAYSKLENVTRAGARYGSLSVYRSSSATANSLPSSTFVNEVRNVAVYGHPDGPGDGRTPMVSGLTTDHVSVNVSFADDLPANVSVSISGLRINGLFGEWQANNKPNAIFQFVGRYAPPIT